jgi:hypothetical protein
VAHEGDSRAADAIEALLYSDDRPRYERWSIDPSWDPPSAMARDRRITDAVARASRRPQAVDVIVRSTSST